MEQPDLARIKARLDELGVGSEVGCPFCGSNTWSIGTDRVVLQVLGDDYSLDIGRGYLAYQVRCDTCGFYRLHSADIVDGAKGESEDGSPEGQQAGDEPD